jgi:hypothetical protein
VQTTLFFVPVVELFGRRPTSTPTLAAAAWSDPQLTPTTIVWPPWPCSARVCLVTANTTATAPGIVNAASIPLATRRVRPTYAGASPLSMFACRVLSSPTSQTHDANPRACCGSTVQTGPHSAGVIRAKTWMLTTPSATADGMTALARRPKSNGWNAIGLACSKSCGSRRPAFN